MGKILADAIAQFRQGNFLSALETAGAVSRVSKDYALARKLKADCHYNIGTAHVFGSGLIDEAEQSFRQCLEIFPNHEEGNNNLARVLVLQKKLAQAIVYYQAAAKLNPKRTSVLFDLALCHERLGQVEQASALYKKLVQLDPTDGAARMRDALLLRSVVPGVAYIDQARRQLDQALDRVLESNCRISDPDRSNGSYFYLSYHGRCNKHVNQKIARAYLHLTPSLQWVAPHVVAWAGPQKKIRLGVISEHLCNHSIGQTSRGLIAELDRSRFDVVVVHLGSPRNDAVHQWINAHASEVAFVSATSLQDARDGIAGLQLDVAFWQDIGMAPFSYFLAYSRLAPVQLTSFGHPDTTGIGTIDYFLSSGLYETDGAQSDYSERLVQLPGAGTLAYYYRPEAPNAHDRQHFGLFPQEHVYICPQTLFKLHPEMDVLFDGISQRDDRARFVLIEPAEESMKEALMARIASHFPQLVAKIVFIPRISDTASYLALLNCADVMLDTVHFNGQNTNLEAFSLGLPVVTLQGALQRGRHTEGMYRAMGFIDLVAHSPDEYVELACKLAGNPEFAAHCKREILARNSVLYENTNFMRALADAVETMVAAAIASRPAPDRPA